MFTSCDVYHRRRRYPAAPDLFFDGYPARERLKAYGPIL